MSIKNTSQKVSQAYLDNPFWKKISEEAIPLDYEQELVAELKKPFTDKSDADRIVWEALMHLGWTDLAEIYKEDFING